MVSPVSVSWCSQRFVRLLREWMTARRVSQSCATAARVSIHCVKHDTQKDKPRLELTTARPLGKQGMHGWPVSVQSSSGVFMCGGWQGVYLYVSSSSFFSLCFNTATIHYLLVFLRSNAITVCLLILQNRSRLHSLSDYTNSPWD